MRTYTEKQRKKILVLLEITPNKEGLIDAHDAAKILSFRALSEQGIKHCYTAESIAQMVRRDKKIVVASAFGPRRRRYDPMEIFSVAITPARGRRKEEKCPSKASI